MNPHDEKLSIMPTTSQHDYIHSKRSDVLGWLASWPKDKEHLNYLSIPHKDNHDEKFNTLLFTEKPLDTSKWVHVFTKEQFESVQDGSRLFHTFEREYSYDH